MSYIPKASSKISTILKLQNNFRLNKPINFLFCDMQDKYIDKIFQNKELLETAEDIAIASKILGMNQIVAIHQRDTFGGTISQIQKHMNDNATYIEKTSFPMFNDEMISKFGEDEMFVLLGIEAHICITQTTYQLLKNNREIIVLSDAISSTQEGYRNSALRNLTELGAYVTTSQSFLFLMLQDANHPKFKELLPILKRLSTRKNSILDETRF